MKKQNPRQNLYARLLAITTTALIFVSAARADYKSTILADHPVGYWPLDLGVDTGGSATDLSGNGNNGTYVNISSPGNEVPGPSPSIPNGVSFDGSTTYVDLSTGPNTAVLNFAGQITMETWVQPASSQNAGTYADIFARGWDLVNYSELEMSVVNSDIFRCGVQSGKYVSSSIGSVTTNWTHLVCTQDGTEWNLYVNGQSVGTYLDGTGAFQFGDPWAIGNGTEGAGSGPGGYPRIFTGNICQVALYNSALTPAQVVAHYYMGLYGTINVAPVITAQPNPSIVYPNAVANFSVAALSAVPLSYQWWKITGSTNVLAGQTNASLTIAHAGPSDVAGYIVVITNIAGAVTSSVANLSLNPPANSIGCNFTFSSAYIGAGNDRTLSPTDAAGVVPATHWNNLIANDPSSANTTWGGFMDNSGAAIPATLTVSGVNDGGYLISTSDTNCVNAGLMYDFWKIDGVTAGNNQDGGISCIFSNLTPGAAYDVYVYVPNYDGARDVGHVTANGGATRYYFWEDDAEYGPLWTCTGGFYDGTPDTNPGGTYAVPVNYVKIPGAIVAGNGTLTVTLTLESGTGDTPDFAVAGLQLIPPSPVAIATSPVSETVYTNGVGVFSVTVTNGVSPIAYQWYMVSAGVTNAIAGATSATYNTAPANVSMNGNRFFAVATDTLGTEAASSMATLTLAAGSASVISVQFQPYNNGVPLYGVQALLPTDETGAFPATNWNALALNVGGGGIPQSFYGLVDQNGIGSGVQLTALGIQNGDVCNAYPVPDSAPITKLLNSFVKNNWGPVFPDFPNALGDGLHVFIFSNLDNSQTYDVYVYLLDSDWENGNFPDVDAGTGVTNYVGSEMNNVSQSSSFVASVNQNPASLGTLAYRDQGNYVRLASIKPTGGAITVSVNYDDPADYLYWYYLGGYGVGTCGVQLVVTVNLAASISGGNILLKFPTQAGSSYTVLYNSSLIGGSWTEVAGPIPGDGTTKTVTIGTSGSQGFYKLLIQ